MSFKSSSKYTSRGEPTLLFDQELNHTLRRMNVPQNPANHGDGINRQLSPQVDAHNQVIVKNLDEGALKRQPPTPRPQDYYRGNVNIIDSDGPLVLPPLQQVHSFVVTSTLM